MTLVRTGFVENEPMRLQVVAYRIRDGMLTRRESIGTRDLVQLDVLWKAATSDADTDRAGDAAGRRHRHADPDLGKQPVAAPGAAAQRAAQPQRAERRADRAAGGAAGARRRGADGQGLPAGGHMRARRRCARQRGVAVITALLLTTLAITIVASLFWQQQVQVRSMENQRLHLQTKWILRGALDWAGLVLRQDGRDNAYTSLDQVWATPLAETRLDQYIERERVQGEVFDATLSGSIIDATSRYNLSNLASERVLDPAQLAIFKRLLTNLQLDPALAERTAKAVAERAGGAAGTRQPPAPARRRPLPASAATPVRLTQLDDLLAIPGYTVEIVDKLRDFVIVLPEVTKVNVNTAPPEVLAAVIENCSLAEANALVARRKSAAWRDLANFSAELQTARTPVADAVEVSEQLFPGAQPGAARPRRARRGSADQPRHRSAQGHDAGVGTAKLERKRDGLTTLYIRLPARADGEGALSRFALVADSGAIDQQGEGVLRGLGDLVAASRRVVLLLAAADVTMLHVKTPPLSARAPEGGAAEPGRRTGAGRPGRMRADGRAGAVGRRHAQHRRGAARLARTAGARAAGAGRAQRWRRCRPSCACRCSRAMSAAPSATREITLRDGLYHGMGLAMASTAGSGAADGARAGRRRPADPVRAGRRAGPVPGAGADAGPAIDARGRPVAALDRRLEDHHARPGARRSVRPAPRAPTGSAGAGRCAWPCWRWWSTWPA